MPIYRQMSWRWLLVGIAAVVSLAAAETQPADPQPIDPDNPPQGSFTDAWYAILLNNHKCGQMRVQMERVAGKAGQPDQIRTQTRMNMKVKRDSAQLSIGIHQKSTETLEGRPLSFWRAIYLGQQPMITEGKIADGKVTLTNSQFGKKLPSKTYTMPDGALMDWGVYREQRKHSMAPGTKYELPLYEPSISPNKVCPTTVEILGPETVDLFGRKVTAIKTLQLMKMPSALGTGTEQKTTTWMTEQGDVVRMEMSVMDIPIEIINCPPAVAKAEDDPAELMVSMVVELDKPLSPDALKSVTYRISLKKAGRGTDRKLPDLVDSRLQRVDHRDDESIQLTVTRAPQRSTATAPAGELSDQDKTLYLAATATVNYHDEKVKELADEGAGDEKDPRKVATRLTHYVHHKVTRKDLTVGFATASEVARSLAGDCTEHGVLLAALGRAKGIPSRLVTGLVHSPSFGGRPNVLVGHLWTQFWIDGEWVDFDSALDQVDLDPSHIAIGYTSADDSAVADLVTTTWLSMGQLSIQVVESVAR